MRGGHKQRVDTMARRMIHRPRLAPGGRRVGPAGWEGSGESGRDFGGEDGG